MIGKRIAGYLGMFTLASSLLAGWFFGPCFQRADTTLLERPFESSNSKRKNTLLERVQEGALVESSHTGNVNSNPFAEDRNSLRTLADFSKGLEPWQIGEPRNSLAKRGMVSYSGDFGGSLRLDLLPPILERDYNYLLEQVRANPESFKSLEGQADLFKQNPEFLNPLTQTPYVFAELGFPLVKGNVLVIPYWANGKGSFSIFFEKPVEGGFKVTESTGDFFTESGEQTFFYPIQSTHEVGDRIGVSYRNFRRVEEGASAEEREAPSLLIKSLSKSPNPLEEWDLSAPESALNALWMSLYSGDFPALVRVCDNSILDPKNPRILPQHGNDLENCSGFFKAPGCRFKVTREYALLGDGGREVFFELGFRDSCKPARADEHKFTFPYLHFSKDEEGSFKYKGMFKPGRDDEAIQTLVLR